MPRTRPLTAELRQQELDKKSSEVLARALRRHRADEKCTDIAFSTKLGVSRASLNNWKETPDKMSLAMARRIAHECKLTPEEWLAVGGYKT